MKPVLFTRRRTAVTGPLTVLVVMGIAGSFLTGCSAPEASTPSADLNIVIRDDGKSVSHEYRLLCNADQVLEGSTLPTAKAACELLVAQPSILTEPADPNRMCTEIYGGPNTAEVTGTLNGKTVNTSFDRHNGCAIGDWDNAAPLIGDASNND
ncbi:hypothetical protein [Glutamicibacter sp. NPDC087344]|uniref:hypothetical protein n=1 Tax=Glutamicibacter sp. NPDC087344 TaxID=3363994 RepID=UPI00382527C1